MWTIATGTALSRGVTAAAVLLQAAWVSAALPRETMESALDRCAAASERLASAGPLFVAAQAGDRRDEAIRRAFREVLDREPTRSELRQYRDRIDADGWTERDIRNDLRSRNQKRVSPREADRIIRRAYQDLLFREPDAEGLRTYRREMLDNGWTEQDVRQALRKSPEYATARGQSAERLVRRVYKELLLREPDAAGLRDYRREMLDNDWTEQDLRKAIRESPEYRAVREKAADATVRRLYKEVLGREPDSQGLVLYRNHMVRDDWTEQAVREALMKSPEYVEKNRMTRERALEIVNRAYRSVLGRDADPGAEGYVQHVLRDKWTEADVARELRKSPEYKSKRR
jgi:TorA maturation chaperone TorD